jgi:hypothetical protein
MSRTWASRKGFTSGFRKSSREPKPMLFAFFSERGVVSSAGASSSRSLRVATLEV